MNGHAELTVEAGKRLQHPPCTSISKEHVPSLPEKSLALHVTGFLPSFIVLPDFGVQSGVSDEKISPLLSTTAGESSNVGVRVSLKISAEFGQSSTGGVLSESTKQATVNC